MVKPTSNVTGRIRLGWSEIAAFMVGAVTASVVTAIELRLTAISPW